MKNDIKKNLIQQYQINNHSDILQSDSLDDNYKIQDEKEDQFQILQGKQIQNEEQEQDEDIEIEQLPTNDYSGYENEAIQQLETFEQLIQQEPLINNKIEQYDLQPDLYELIYTHYTNIKKHYPRKLVNRLFGITLIYLLITIMQQQYQTICQQELILQNQEMQLKQFKNITEHYKNIHSQLNSLEARQKFDQDETKDNFQYFFSQFQQIQLQQQCGANNNNKKYFQKQQVDKQQYQEQNNNFEPQYNIDEKLEEFKEDLRKIYTIIVSLLQQYVQFILHLLKNNQ